MDLRSATVAVTGATGFVGSHVVLELLARGAAVRCVVRSPEKAAWLVERGATVARADLNDPDALAAAFAGADAVVANAALAAGWKPTAPEAFHAANVGGTENTFQALAAAGTRRVVKVSTVAVQRTRLNAPMVEEPAGVADRDWTNAVTNRHYARTKAAAEQHAWEAAERAGIALTVVRPGPVYGPRDDKMTARYAAWMRRAVVLAPTLRIPHVHAGDVAHAIAGALENDGSAGKAYNVTGPSVSVREVLSTWRRITGAGPWLIPVPVPVWVGYDNAAAERDLGFRPRSLEAGLRDVITSLGR